MIRERFNFPQNDYFTSDNNPFCDDCPQNPEHYIKEAFFSLALLVQPEPYSLNFYTNLDYGGYLGHHFHNVVFLSVQNLERWIVEFLNPNISIPFISVGVQRLIMDIDNKNINENRRFVLGADKDFNKQYQQIIEFVRANNGVLKHE